MAAALPDRPDTVLQWVALPDREGLPDEDSQREMVAHALDDCVSRELLLAEEHLDIVGLAVLLKESEAVVEVDTVRHALLEKDTVAHPDDEAAGESDGLMVEEGDSVVVGQALVVAEELRLPLVVEHSDVLGLPEELSDGEGVVDTEPDPQMLGVCVTVARPEDVEAELGVPLTDTLVHLLAVAQGHGVPDAVAPEDWEEVPHGEKVPELLKEAVAQKVAL